jgi:hypothetical protein
MRIWINEKKNTLSSKIQAEVETEYRKIKAAEPPKKVEEKSVPDQEEPVKIEEIEMFIDTSSKPAEKKEEEQVGYSADDKAAIQDLVDKKFD